MAFETPYGAPQGGMAQPQNKPQQAYPYKVKPQPQQGGLSPLLNQVMGTPQKEAQPMMQPMGAQDNERGPMVENFGAPDANQFNPYQGTPAPQQPQAAQQTGGAPSLVPQGAMDQAFQNIANIKPYEPTAKLPTQEELGGYAGRVYEQQLGLLSGSVDKRQAQEKAQLAQQMANRGIPIGSEAYAREQATLAERQSAENAQLRSQALQFGQQAARDEYSRIMDQYRTGMDEATLRSNLGYQGLQALSPLAQTQYGAGEQRFLQGQQLGFQGTEGAAERASREAMQKTGIAAEQTAQASQQQFEAGQLEKTIAGNERLQGLQADTQKALAGMEIAGKFDLQKLSGQQQQELIDKQAKIDTDLAYLNRDTQLQVIGKQFENEKWAKQFDATTQKDLLQMNLDQQDKQFVASMDMEEKKFVQQQYEFLQNLGLSKEQLAASTQIQLKQLAESRRQFDKQLLNKIKNDDSLLQLQRDQLAELISSNKRDDATKRYIADRAASGNRLSAEDEGNAASAKASGTLQGTINAINAQVDAGILTPAQRDRAVQNLVGSKGSGGVSYGIK